MEKKQFNKIGTEVAPALKVSILEQIIDSPRKVIMMVKGLTKVGMKIDSDVSKGFVVSNIKHSV